MTNYNVTQLDSGIKVITEKLPYVKSFSLGFWFNVGSRDETAENNGISHFIEHMLFKGTKNRTAKEISDDVESLGGYLNAFTSKEHTCYYGRGLKDHLEKTFEVLSDMVQNSIFDEEEIKKESSVIVDELYDIEDTPEELIFDKFEGKMFSDSSLAMPIIGSEENINNFNRNTILEFINKNYSNNKFLIVVSGNVDHSNIVSLAEKYISRNNQSKGIERKVELKDYFGTEVYNKNIQQTHVIYGRRVPGYSSEKRIPLNVLSHILGEGSSSRIFQRVREENGLTYQINTFLNSFFDVSTLGIYFSTNDKSVLNVIDLIKNEIKNIKSEGITKTELDRAREYWKGNIILGLENTTNRMVRIANSFLYFNRFKSLDETIDKINSVTVDNINSLAEEYLDEDSFSEIILGTENFKLSSTN